MHTLQQACALAQDILWEYVLVSCNCVANLSAELCTFKMFHDSPQMGITVCNTSFECKKNMSAKEINHQHREVYEYTGIS